MKELNINFPINLQIQYNFSQNPDRVGYRIDPKIHVKEHRAWSSQENCDDQSRDLALLTEDLEFVDGTGTDKWSG